MSVEKTIFHCVAILILCAFVCFFLTSAIITIIKDAKKRGVSPVDECIFMGLGIALMLSIAVLPAAYIYQHL